jgi:hypothetical protein
LKWKKVFKAGKESKNSFNSSGFFTKINSSEQNIYRNRRLKIQF